MKKHVQTDSEWQEEMSQKIIDEIQCELYLDMPFMKLALSALSPKVNEQLYSMATDGTYIYYNPIRLIDIFQYCRYVCIRSYTSIAGRSISKCKQNGAGYIEPCTLFFRLGRVMLLGILVVNIALNVKLQLLADVDRAFVEQHQKHVHVVIFEMIPDGFLRYGKRFFFRTAVSP